MLTIYSIVRTERGLRGATWMLVVLLVLFSATIPAWPPLERIRKDYRPGDFGQRLVLAAILLMLGLSGVIGLCLGPFRSFGGDLFMNTTFYAGTHAPIFIVLLSSLLFSRKYGALRLLRLESGQTDLVAGTLIPLTAALFALGFYMVNIEPFHLEITRHPLTLPRLAKGTDPIRILQMSDTHFDSYWPKGHNFVKRSYAKGRAGFDPDIILLTGDYAHGIEPETFLGFFRGLEAPGGVFACHGNFNERDRLIAESCPNIRFLTNEWATTTVRGQEIALIGINFDSRYKLAKLVEEVPARLPRLVLCHSPDAFIEGRELPVDMVFTGHTHGGQVAIPWWGAVITLSELGPKYAAGLFEENGVYLYVNRGLALEIGPIPKMRLAARPEISLFELNGREKPNVPGYVR